MRPGGPEDPGRERVSRKGWGFLDPEPLPAVRPSSPSPVPDHPQAAGPAGRLAAQGSAQRPLRPRVPSPSSRCPRARPAHSPGHLGYPAAPGGRALPGDPTETKAGTEGGCGALEPRREARPGAPSWCGRGFGHPGGTRDGATRRKLLFRSPLLSQETHATRLGGRCHGPCPQPARPGDEDAVALRPPGSGRGRASARPLLQEARPSHPSPLCRGGLSPLPAPCVAAAAARPWLGRDPRTYHVAFRAWLTIHSRHTLGGIETEKNQQGSTGKAQ